MIRRNSWKEYQKQIADDRYYYARSCIRQNFFPGSEKAFIDILQNDLGRDLHGHRLPLRHRAARNDHDRRSAAIRLDDRSGL